MRSFLISFLKFIVVNLLIYFALQIFSVGTTHTLSIAKATKADAGDYVITAANSVGSAVGSVALMVVEASEKSDHSKYV